MQVFALFLPFPQSYRVCLIVVCSSSRAKIKEDLQIAGCYRIYGALSDTKARVHPSDPCMCVDCHRDKIPGRSLVEKRTLNTHSTISEVEEYFIMSNFKTRANWNEPSALPCSSPYSTSSHVRFSAVERSEPVVSSFAAPSMDDCRFVASDTHKNARNVTNTSSIQTQPGLSYSPLSSSSNHAGLLLSSQNPSIRRSKTPPWLIVMARIL